MINCGGEWWVTYVSFGDDWCNMIQFREGKSIGYRDWTNPDWFCWCSISHDNRTWKICTWWLSPKHLPSNQPLETSFRGWYLSYSCFMLLIQLRLVTITSNWLLRAERPSSHMFPRWATPRECQWRCRGARVATKWLVPPGPIPELVETQTGSST